MAPRGRIGESDVLQAQSDYSNTFNWGGKSTPCWPGVDLRRRRQAQPNYANTHPAHDHRGAPNNGASVVDGRAPVQWNTFTSRNLGLYAQDTVSLTNTLKLVGGLRYDDFEGASYRNPTGTISNKISDSLVSPRVGLIFQPDEAVFVLRVVRHFGNNTSGDTYQFGNLGASNQPRRHRRKSRNIELAASLSCSNAAHCWA